MLVMGVDVGISTGYAILTSETLERVTSGTLVIGGKADHSTYDYLQYIIETNKPDIIIFEFPIEDRKNPYNDVLKAIAGMYTEATANAVKNNRLSTKVHSIIPAQWKTTPSYRFTLNHWTGNRQVTKHEKDAVRIAHWAIKFGNLIPDQKPLAV